MRILSRLLVFGLVGAGVYLLKAQTSPPAAGGMTPAEEQRAREMLRQPVPTAKPASVAAPAAAPATAPAIDSSTTKLIDDARRHVQQQTNQVTTPSDEEIRERELKRIEAETQKAAETRSAAPVAVKPAVTNAVAAPPPVAPRTLTSEEEARARALLEQPAAPPTATAPPPTTVQPAPVAPVVTAPPPATVGATAAPSSLSPEAESRARALLEQTAPAVPAPKVVIPPPAVVTTRPPAAVTNPPPVVVTPPPAAAAVAPPQTIKAPPALNPEDEARAQQLLNRTTGAAQPAKIPTQLQAEREAEQARLRAQQEAAKRRVEAEAQQRLEEQRRAEQAAKAAAAATPPAAPPPVTTAPVAAAPPIAPTITVPPSPLSADEESKARMLLEQSLAQQAQATSAKPETEIEKMTEKERREAEKRIAKESERRQAGMAKPPAGAGTAAAAAATAPPPYQPMPPGSASKQERLQALLDAYKKDLIDPMQYHRERAKILAEP